MKKIILILLMGILMNPTFHLYGMKITLAGDLTAARDRAHLARLLMFKTKLVNVNNLDIIQNNLRLNDGTHVHFMSQHGFDSATIYVPPKPVRKKKEEIEEHPQLILPYFNATERFPMEGLLVFRSGYKLTEPYELFSPYWQYKDTFTNTFFNAYTPYSYTDSNNQEQILEWQVKKYIDPFTGVYWDEIPWMGSGFGWDPVFNDKYVEGEDVNKPHSIELVTLFSTFPEESPGVWPDWAIGEGTKALMLNGTQLHSYSYSGELIDPDAVIVELKASGEVPQWQDNAIDQSDPSKYAALYRTRDHHILRTNAGYDFSYVYTNHKLIFQGLGHTHEITEVSLPDYCISYHEHLYGWTESYAYRVVLTMRTRLYKVGDKYVSLFAIRADPQDPADGGDRAPTQKFIGCAVEGGDVNVVDVTDGVEFMDEFETLILDSPSLLPNFGLLIRRGPADIMHTFNFVKEQ